MRGRAIVAPLLLTVLLAASLPLATAQNNTDSKLADDGSGDVGVTGPDGEPAGTVPAGTFDGMDLTGVGIMAEDDASVTFFVDVAAISASSDPPVPFADPDYYVYFRFHDKEYRVSIITSLQNAFNDAVGRTGVLAFLQEDTGDNWRTVAAGTGEIIDADNRVTATIPREAIVDQDQAPLARNSRLDAFVAEARSLAGFQFGVPGPTGGAPLVQYNGVGLVDRAPDTDVGSSYTMLTGEVFQSGSLLSLTSEPVRWTNGEATTLVYEVTLQNRGAAAERVTVSTTDIPSTWTIAHSDVIEIGAGESQNVTFLVSIPFSHGHGEFKEFKVHFMADGGHSSTMLAVYWPLIPQPAGHHDTLWLHSRNNPADPPFDAMFKGTQVWMNAATSDVDDQDEGVDVPANFAAPSGAFAAFSGGSTDGFASWFLSLNPQLRMGLDFDLSRTGHLALNTELKTPIMDPVLDVALGYLVIEENRNGRGNNFEWTQIGNGSASLTGQQQGNVGWTVDLTIDSEFDEIPFRTDGSLGLSITLRGVMGGTGFVAAEYAHPTIKTAGSTLQLPLFEYHAPVDESFVTSSAIDLRIPGGGQQRQVNPDEAVVYQFEITYQGDRFDEFQLDLTGTNAEWATILGDETIMLGPGMTRTLALEVRAPRDAGAGDTADVTITATSTRNAAIQGGIRTLTTVTTSEDLPDETGKGATLNDELSEGQDSPGAPVALLTGALAALALVGRRRFGGRSA